LHRARIDSRRRKLTYDAELNSLPDGCFVDLGGNAHLVWGESVFLWAPGGYVRRDSRANALTVTVLTPRPVVECFRQGYRPEIHESCLAL
jgi:hypothetical protein